MALPLLLLLPLLAPPVTFHDCPSSRAGACASTPPAAAAAAAADDDDDDDDDNDDDKEEEETCLPARTRSHSTRLREIAKLYRHLAALYEEEAEEAEEAE